MIPTRRIAATLALAALAGATTTGCQQQKAHHDPEVEWMLPAAPAGESDAVDVVDAPGLGASDTLGHAIFTRHDPRFAQAQAARLAPLLTDNDTPTLDLHSLTPFVELDPNFDLFAWSAAPIASARAPIIK